MFYPTSYTLNVLVMHSFLPRRPSDLAEDQMLAHGGVPARPDRRGLKPGDDIERICGKLPVPDPALDPVGLGYHRDQSGLDRKSTRLKSSNIGIPYAILYLKYNISNR